MKNKRAANVLPRGAVLLALLVVASIAVACGRGEGQSSPEPATPTPSRELSAPELKYLLIDHYGGVFYCDPDFYPVARPEVEQQRAIEEFPGIRANTDEYQAILDRLGIAEDAEVTEEFQLQIYREHKRLNALTLSPLDGSYAFQMRIGETDGFNVQGTVSRSGAVTETSREQSFNTCPICMDENALIDTPSGPMLISSIRVGAIVWTQGATGARVAMSVIAAGSTPAPEGHEMVRVVLADGRTVQASQGHPLPDGRSFTDVKAGDVVDGSIVVSAELVRYGGSRTYDILPAGDSGVYWADGVPVGSTLRSR